MKNIENWQEARALLKRNRRELTDNVKDWIENDDTTSENWSKYVYLNITRTIMKATFENYKGNMPLSKVKFRDQITEDEAYSLTRMEMLAADLVEQIDEIAPKLTAKEKYYVLSERLLTIGESLGRVISITIQKFFEEKEKGNE